MTQTTTIYKKHKNISYGVIITVILLWITVINHVWYEADPIDIKNSIIEHKKAKKTRNDASNASFPLAHKFLSDQISKDEFKKQLLSLEESFLSHKEKSALLFKKTKRLQAEHQTFGFSNYNVFSFQLSARIVLFFCILLLMISNIIRNKSNLLIKALNFAALNFLIICAFYTLWVFYKGDDLNIFAYYSLILSMAIGLGFFAFFMITAICKSIDENKTRNENIGLKLGEAFNLLKEQVAQEKIKN